MYVTARAFTAVQNLNVSELIDKEIEPPYAEKEIRPFLSSLVRSSILDSANFDKSLEWFEVRKQILLILVESEIVNNIVALLQVNYNELEVDIKKEQQLR
jgi:integrator complex subunit 2